MYWKLVKFVVLKNFIFEMRKEKYDNSGVAGS